MIRVAKIAAPLMLLASVACNKSTAPEPSTTPTATESTPATAPTTSAPETHAVLGQPAPDFSLTDLEGKTHELSAYKGKTVVLEWFNPDCPFVNQSHTEGTLKGMAKNFIGDDLVWLAINSNAEGMQGHGKAANEAGRDRYGITYPILLDPTGEVGRAYGAKRTPHMYVIDPTGKLVYRGAIDNSKGGDLEDVPEVENYVAKTIELVKAKQPVDMGEVPAWGCTVKYGK